MPDWAQTGLKIAAVTGRLLDLKILAQTGAIESVEDWLTACANAAVLDVVDGQWRFIDKTEGGHRPTVSPGVTQPDHPAGRPAHRRFVRRNFDVEPERSA